MQIQEDPRAKTTRELQRRYRDARSDWDTEARKDIDCFYGNHFSDNEVDELESRNQERGQAGNITRPYRKFKEIIYS